MRITRKAIDTIRLNVANCFVETGGIMGSQDGILISEIIMDYIDNTEYKCCYAPNVQYFNECIAEWQQQNKYFAGMFHTHFYNVGTLSNEDIKYINVIMKAMPKEVEKLYFPIYILPRQELICYEATRENDSVLIRKDILEVV